jgi:fatty acid/phospholipid biosynthesis enzyme
MRIGINASGGDNPVVTMLGAYNAAIANPEIEIWLYLGLRHCQMIDENIHMFPRAAQNLAIEETDGRNDLHSALEDLCSGEIDALITGSNSKKLAACSHVSSLWQKPYWPGLIAPIPVQNGIGYMMDVGATARVTDPDVFIGWAELGAKFLQSQCGIAAPTIGLCNIATERAYPELGQIHEVLSDKIANYVGYVEPYQFVDSAVDLWLMEGFVGNQNLKLLEAYMRFLTRSYARELDMAAAEVIKAKASQLFSYEAHLVSPYLTQSGRWIFRVHGAANHKAVSMAFSLAAQKYNLAQPMW